ncbi:hypothetical protein Cgig2_018459 [Carnegiea gigantea]|uniref:Uncharacterized protein n=1 Tax=Carnegiea gigantea TaxID=171969 RepID=A0A9Q1QFY9_9CARY|nr:hypothetical protein Cgig2_018459 [Carnegiea gigantea]
MVCYFHPLLFELLKIQLKEVFDDEVRNFILWRRRILEMHSTQSQLLKDEGNRFFRTKDYQMAISRNDKVPQYLCVIALEFDDDARLMKELDISLNLNLGGSWSKLYAYEDSRVTSSVDHDTRMEEMGKGDSQSSDSIMNFNECGNYPKSSSFDISKSTILSFQHLRRLT